MEMNNDQKYFPMFCINILLTAKYPKSGMEIHCILSICTPIKMTSSSFDSILIKCSEKRYNNVADSIKNIVPTTTVNVKAD